MFEETVPEAILQKRVHNSRVQFLVTWFDGMSIFVYTLQK